MTRDAPGAAERSVLFRFATVSAVPEPQTPVPGPKTPENTAAEPVDAPFLGDGTGTALGLSVGALAGLTLLDHLGLGLGLGLASGVAADVLGGGRLTRWLAGRRRSS